MITWSALRTIIRSLVSETATAITDVELKDAMNAALLAVHGDLVVVVEPTTITMVTGTTIYNVPASFLYVQALWDASGNPIPDYAWEVRAGGGGTSPTSPKVIFGVGFTPTTGQNVTIAGWQAKTVKIAGPPITFASVIANDTDDIAIDPGWLIEACLTALHASQGGTASDLADWHKLEAGESRHSARALMELKEQLMPTIPPAFRPTPGARLVPGRAE